MGVLTKPDLMDPGTEGSLAAILDGNVVKLAAHGWYVVLNRGQRALDARASGADALDREQSFFDDRLAALRDARPARFGVPRLVAHLGDVLGAHIAADAPGLHPRAAGRAGRADAAAPRTGGCGSRGRRRLDDSAAPRSRRGAGGPGTRSPPSAGRRRRRGPRAPRRADGGPARRRRCGRRARRRGGRRAAARRSGPAARRGARRAGRRRSSVPDRARRRRTRARRARAGPGSGPRTSRGPPA